MTTEQREAPQTYTCRSQAMTCMLPSGASIRFKDGTYKAETQGEVNDFEAFLSVQKPAHRSKYNRIDYRLAAQIAEQHLAQRQPAATQGTSTSAHRPHAANTVNSLIGQVEDAEVVAAEIARVAAGGDPNVKSEILELEPQVSPLPELKPGEVAVAGAEVDPNLPIAGAVPAEVAPIEKSALKLG